MKASAAGLKKFNFKRFAIDHGEKIGLGLIVLVAVAILWSARWSAYPKQPEEMEQAAEKAEQELVASTWPEAEQATYSTRYDVRNEIAGMLSPADITAYQYPTGHSPYWPLVPPTQPIQEPQWVAVRDVRATSDRFIMALASKPNDLLASDTTAGKAGTKKTTEEEIPAKFRKRGAGAGAGFPGAGFPGESDAGFPGYSGELAYPGAGGGHGAGMAGAMAPGAMAPGFPGGGYGAGGYGDDMYGMGYGGYVGPVVEGRGVRFVSIRGVYPLKEQAEKVMRAMNYPPTTKAEEMVEILDFEVQRQAAGPGENPWSDKDEDWETLDYKFAIDVLNEAADFDADVVQVGITDPAITMPLPMRVVGMWDEEATHPAVKQFHLNEAGKELQREVMDKIMERLDEAKKLQESQRRARGFSVIQRDMRRAGAALFSTYGSAEQRSALYTGMANDLGQYDAETLKKIVENSITASGHLLLFRYFDFDVEPGKAYRYRVRVILKNPAYDFPPEMAILPQVVQGETRATEWSEPTSPVIVQDDSAYFLARADSRRGGPPAAQMEVFQWLPDVGTIAKVDSLSTQVGQYVGGLVRNVEVIDPAKQKYEPKEVPVNSTDMLVDVLDAPSSVGELHADLGLDSSVLGLPDVAIVADEYGQLSTIDPISRESQKQRIATEFEWWQKQFQYIKERPETMPGEAGVMELLGGYPGAPGAAGGHGAGGKDKKKKKGRKANPLRMSPYGAMGMYGP